MVLRTHLAVVICLISLFCEMSLTYFYGYYLKGNLTQKLISKIKIKNTFKSNINNNALITFFLRLTPVAVEPVSFYMGANHYNFGEYIIASITGILPRMMLFIMIGDTFKNSITMGKIAIFIIFIIIWTYGTFFLKKKYIE
jgi:membrane protein DedA with SNARE-associated domain